MNHTVVIWNPNSGRADQALVARDRLDGRSNTVVRETNSADDAVQFATEAAMNNAELIVAAGGDGTVNSVANGIVRAGCNAAMAVLPIGTANDFALSLAIPDDFERAVDLFDTGHRRPIDLVEVETDTNQHCFANVAAGGNSDRVTELLTDELKARWGPLCYLRGAIGVLADLETFEVSVTFDDEDPVEVDLWNVIIANGRTNAGHLQVAPRASLEDGLLDVILVRDGTLIDVAAITARYVLADYLESDQVVYRQVRSLSMKSTPSMRFSIDGEAINEQPVVFRSKQAALSVVVGDDYCETPLSFRNTDQR